MSECENNFWSLSKSLSVVFGAINVIIGIIAALCNLVILFVFYKNRRLHSRSSCCLISLVMTDFLVGFLLEPLFLAELFKKDARINCGLNTFRRFVTSMLMGASMSSIALISYDRYLLLSKSNQYNSHMTVRKTAFLIFLCWVLPGLSPLLNYTFAGHGFFSAVIFLYTFLMLFVILWSYFTIMKIVRKNEIQMKQILQTDGRNINAAVAKRNKTSRGRIKAARAIMVVLLCFVLSNAPLTCYLAIAAGGSMAGRPLLGSQAIDVIYVATITTTLMNSIINPVIYYLRIPDFKHSLLRLVGIRLRNRVSFESTNVIECTPKP